MAESQLLKLTTDLKLLKFEPNNEPYIQFPIGYTHSFLVNDLIPQSVSDFYILNRTSVDFPIRAGALDFDLKTQTFTTANKIDKERIKKFYKDSPRGPAFLAKQVGLQLSNPKIETDSILPGFGDPYNFPSIIENTRFYNAGLNTLEQVGVQGTGIHGVRHGIIPFNPFQKGYVDIVNAQNIKNDYSTNRLLTLKELKLNQTITSSTTNLVFRKNASRLGISFNNNTLFQYLGGPESVYGVGITTIRRYDNTDFKPERGRAAGLSARSYGDIQKISEDIGTVDGVIQNYRYVNRFGTGDPGKIIVDYSNSGFMVGGKPVDYTYKIPGAADVLNMASLMYFENSKNPWKVGDFVDVQHKDIIKFGFEAIDNNNTANSIAAFFRAHLSGISDNHQASISPFKYAGRGEDFYTYQGVSRNISFSFKISPQTRDELRPLYQKLNFLISQVYPDYSRNGIMRAPLIRLTIGDYLYRVAGLLENISITVDDNVPWEINLEESDEVRQLPKVINVQCIFKPIQDFLPSRAVYSSDSVRNKGTQTLATNEDNFMQDNSMNVPYIAEYNPNGGSFVDQQPLDITPVVILADVTNRADKEIINSWNEYPKHINPKIEIPTPAKTSRQVTRNYKDVTSKQKTTRVTRNPTDLERQLLSQREGE